MSETPRWPAAWVRAALDLAVLGALADGPRHGYAIAQELQVRGFGRLRGGSLYPVLARLEEGGHVAAAWVDAGSGPARKDYRLTPEGRAHLARGLASWAELGDALRTEEGS
ncbi:helix-turn-helix transcriptional regulator [uncultured Serinicoccus sp.]|uniref:PadR family transcriptional regulator n=1 Tax=uncultured Serinicoccus sp. TaxID=735514 RepID=UPI00260EA4BB|nr:helix-turn-helix transcriptional regulator [uncultured Serinicoccus sp.]